MEAIETVFVGVMCLGLLGYLLWALSHPEQL